MARFYVLTIEPTLFGDTALVREWGRRGQRGWRRMDLFAGRVQAVEALEAWLVRKTRRGYVPKKSRALNAISQPASLIESWPRHFIQADSCFAHYGSNPCRNASATACGRVDAARFCLALSR
ncbi:WGR domain-containing protein [Bradyrhizobium sp. STM 3561]|uniref:WGR domain-containing protein n=1 Tax=Bradyrhizobium sp. STM 3561 TaxID=578923 RepID=UPI00388DDF63